MGQGRVKKLQTALPTSPNKGMKERGQHSTIGKGESKQPPKKVRGKKGRRGGRGGGKEKEGEKGKEKKEELRGGERGVC